ncbi:MAG: iron ABC transporter permease [Candidatus Lokiarchaeota archaeon]|nr:iron ABC transporter permease [Candidatus Harpocratesius repetitus]
MITNRRNKSKLKKKFGVLTPFGVVLICLLVLVAFFLTFFYFPLGTVFQFAFSLNDFESSKTFAEIISYSLNLRALQFSLIEALISTFFCLGLGIPVGIFIAKYHFKGRKIFLQIMTIPFVLPPIVVLIGFVIVYGDGGWINTLWKSISSESYGLLSIYGSYVGIILAHVFYNISVVVQFMIPAWQQLNYDQIDVARSIGASQWKIFWKIVFPQIRSSLISSALLVFIYSFNSFAIVLYLGNAQLQTLEVRIYKLMQVSFDYRSGTILAIMQLLINILLILAYLQLDRSKIRTNSNAKSTFEYKHIIFHNLSKTQKMKLIGRVFFLGIVLIFEILPLIAVIITAFTPIGESNSIFTGFSLLFSSSYDPLLGASIFRLLINTLIFAFITMIITQIFTFAILLIYRRRYHSISQYKYSSIDKILALFIILPMATSTITLALGLFLQFKDSILYLKYPWVLIIAAHILIGVPFATRTVINAYNRIDTELINVASTLGASNWVIFRKIEFPLIKRSLFIGALFSFAISIGEFGATNFLARGKFGTLSLAISKLMYTRNIQLTASMATILIAITFLSFIIIQHLGESRFCI